MTGADEAIEAAAREETARIVSTLVSVTGDFALAEDCLQDAFAKAITHWSRDGVPSRPGAWLTTVAKNRATDLLRRRSTESRALERLGVDDGIEGDDGGEERGAMDDRLRLIFTCCHPALPMEARVALTLRTVAGLSAAQIARAFLITEAAMEKRLVRARAKIKNAGIPYRVPARDALPERRDGVLAVIYLLFTEGYSATGGDALLRTPLMLEAIRMGRLLVELMPRDREVRGSLALLLVQNARSASRVDDEGELVTLEHQDRALWDRDAVAEAALLIGLDVSRESQGPYELQARIALCHMSAPDALSTDFERIASLYEALAAIAPSPVVELARAVALGMARGPDSGLRHLASKAEALSDYYLLPATRADLLRRLGRHVEAASEYARAIELAPTDIERRYLARRLAEVTPAAP